MMIFRSLLGVLLSACVLSAQALADEWSGNVALEFRHFPQQAVDSRQHGDNLSLSAEPEYARVWDDGRQSVVFKAFGRWDQHDDERSHADIRELMWNKAAEAWELRLGIGKVFWGVTESNHLVDIINQTDALENIDQEDKLGQPMANLALVRDWGTLDIFALPYFRERTFPGVEGRPRSQPQVDTEQVRYQSGKKEKHVDYAVRWSRSIEEWDIGLSYFAGTSRDPRLVLGTNAAGEAVWVQHYDLIKQKGLDAQGTFDAWLWKLEAIQRSGQGKEYIATTAGFEYTFFGVFDSDADLGILAEHLYDDRGAAATTPLQDDILLGARLTLNDAQSSELLAGIISDRHTNASSFNLEASRRFGNNIKLYLEARVYKSAPANDPAYSYRNDDYVQLELFYYF